MNRFGCLFLALFLGLTACAGNSAAHRAKIINQEVARISPPPDSLGGDANYRIDSMVLGEKVTKDERKVVVASEIEALLKFRVEKLFSTWGSDPQASKGTLVITPRIDDLRIVSGGARLWVGAMAGSSNIDLALDLAEESATSETFTAQISIDSGGMSGVWSGGSSDRNLVNYAVDIATAYLSRNHPTTIGETIN